MSPMGRPKSDNPKSTQLAVRLDKDTLAKLDACTIAYNESRVQIIRRGIDKLFDDLKEK